MKSHPLGCPNNWWCSQFLWLLHDLACCDKKNHQTSSVEHVLVHLHWRKFSLFNQHWSLGDQHKELSWYKGCCHWNFGWLPLFERHNHHSTLLCLLPKRFQICDFDHGVATDCYRFNFFAGFQEPQEVCSTEKRLQCFLHVHLFDTSSGSVLHDDNHSAKMFQIHSERVLCYYRADASLAHPSNCCCHCGRTQDLEEQTRTHQL